MEIENKVIPMHNAPLTFNNKVINGYWSKLQPVGYSRFKLIVRGCVYETGDPSSYCQWGQLGFGWNGNNPVYGEDYYTVESYQLVNATPWDDGANGYLDNWFKGIGVKSDYTYDYGHKDDYYGEVIFTTNEIIMPETIGLITTTNQSYYTQRPEHFEFYGWDSDNWVLIADVLGLYTNMGDEVETVYMI